MQTSDVFISYASEDRDRIQDLVVALETTDLSVWWDRHIHTGRAFDREIEQALDAARCVVVVWSQASVESDWVRTEAAEGMERGILVPICIDDVKPPLAFRRLQTLNCTGSANVKFTEVLSAIRDLLPTRSAAAGASPPLVSEPVQHEARQTHEIRTRPRIAVREVAFIAADPAMHNIGQIVHAELTSYLQAIYRYDAVAGTEQDLDYQIDLRFGGNLQDGRVVLQILSPEHGFNQTARATIREEMSSDQCEWLASSLLFCLDTSLRENMVSRLDGVPDGKLDLEGLLWGARDLGAKPDSDGHYQRVKRAISMDPHSGPAHAELAFAAIILRHSVGVSREDLRLNRIRSLVQRAIELSPSDPIVLNRAGYVLSQTGDADRALVLLEEAGRLLPPMLRGANFPLVRLGRATEALDIMGRYSRWGLPQVPEEWSAHAEAHAANENYSAVIDVAGRGLERARSQRLVLRAHYANALAMLGQLGAAQREWTNVRQDAPSFTAASWRRAWQIQCNSDDLVDRLSAGLERLQD